MSVQLPCGHTIDNIDDEVRVRVISESICMSGGVVPSVEYLSLCKACYEERGGWCDYLINSDEDERKWLVTVLNNQ